MGPAARCPHGRVRRGELGQANRSASVVPRSMRLGRADRAVCAGAVGCCGIRCCPSVHRCGNPVSGPIPRRWCARSEQPRAPSLESRAGPCVCQREGRIVSQWVHCIPCLEICERLASHERCMAVGVDCFAPCPLSMAALSVGTALRARAAIFGLRASATRGPRLSIGPHLSGCQLVRLRGAETSHAQCVFLPLRALHCAGSVLSWRIRAKRGRAVLCPLPFSEGAWWTGATRPAAVPL